MNKLKTVLLACATALAMPTIATAGPGDKTEQRTTEKAQKTSISDAERSELAHRHHVNQMEIEMGRLAAKQGGREVKRFGNMLIKEHQKANKDVQALAKKLGVSTTQPMTEADRAEHDQMTADMERLRSLSGEEFDREFLRVMAEGHQREIARVTAAMPTVNHTQVRALLDKTLPSLRKHAEAADKASTKLGFGPVGGSEQDTSGRASGATGTGAAGTGATGTGTVRGTTGSGTGTTRGTTPGTARGTSGTTGSDNARGTSAGATGTNRDTTGAARGTSGTTGADNARGTSGSDAARGTSGSTGSDAARGTSGTSGSTGSDAARGTGSMPNGSDTIDGSWNPDRGAGAGTGTYDTRNPSSQGTGTSDLNRGTGTRPLDGSTGTSGTGASTGTDGTMDDDDVNSPDKSGNTTSPVTGRPYPPTPAPGTTPPGSTPPRTPGSPTSPTQPY